MRNRIFDILLVVVILAAAGFIGYRYLSSSKPSESAAVGDSGASAVATAPAVSLERGEERPAHPQWLLEKVQPISTEKYKVILEKHTSTLVQKIETTGCRGNSKPTPAVSLLDDTVAARVKKAELQFLFGFKQPRCYKKGQKLAVLHYASSESAPFVTLMGEVAVESIVEHDPTQMPDELLKEMGISREEYNDFVGFRRPDGLKDMVIKFGELKTAKASEGTVPSGFPRAEVVTNAEVQSLLARVPNLRVLDVRTAEEFHAGRIQAQSVKNVPFVLAAGIPKEFSWAVLNRDVLKSSFDTTLLGQGIGPVLVYGTSVNDPRPVYAMADLIRLGYRQIYWLREGLSSN